MNLPSFETLKKAFGYTLEYIRYHGSILQPSSDEQLDILEESLKTATSLDQLAPLCMMPIKNRNLGMNPIVPFKNSPLFTTSLQFGQATLEWYFMYGNCGKFAYNFIIFCIPTCTPEIASDLGIKGQDGYIYSLTGGYGPLSPGGNSSGWVTIPISYFQAVYTTPTQSTFNFDAVLPDTNIIKKLSFSSSDIGKFNLDVQWVDKSKGMVGIKSEMSSSSAPYLNGSDGCVPCISGVGTLYWSYTNMKVNSSVGQVVGGSPNEFIGSGVGWFDHQWMQGGHLESETIAAILNIENSLTSPKPVRWLWINIQDYTTQEQYMIVVYLQTESIKMNDTYTSSMVNHYNSIDGPKFLDGDSASILVQKTFTTPDGAYTYPTQYLIKVNGKNYILKASFGNSLVYLPSGVINWEGPGILYDETETKVIGGCFFEANQVTSEDNLMKNIMTRAGVSLEHIDVFNSAGNANGGLVVFLSVIWLVFLILLCLLILWLMYKTIVWIKNKAL